MQFDLEPGDFVINPDKKEWGIGQIQSIIKNKVTVKLIDNTIVTKHIIHWVRSKDYFCITESNFWDRFTD